MSFRVLIPPDLPLDQHAIFAEAAIKAATERARIEQERRDEIEARKKATAEALAEIERQNKERAEKKAKAQVERDRASFEDSLRRAFFVANPSASEADFLRNRDKLRDEALRERAAAELKGRENLVEISKGILKKRGSYGIL